MVGIRPRNDGRMGSGGFANSRKGRYETQAERYSGARMLVRGEERTCLLHGRM